MNNTLEVKIPHTQFGVAHFITARFSARAFTDQPISEADLNTLFEAASWAPSSINEQPWEFYFAYQGTEGFQKIWECLMPGNQPWAKNAAVLAVSIARKNFAANEKPNVSAEHDLGMANSNLLLQAAEMGIYGHPMGGFDKHMAAAMLGLAESHHPICVLALGYLGDPEILEEPYKSRELTPRSRKPVADFTHEV